ncbi:MAG: hypothetical protein K8R56_01655 [Candidatus Eisenbacteria bacterium]|nr:hypothetical protein [Candidatus Eisenbacteria bacterium]
MFAGRMRMQLCAALLLVATTAESMAAVAPGTLLRVRTTASRGVLAEVHEGRFVSGSPELVITTVAAGDTLRFRDDEVAQVERYTGALARRSVFGTVIGAVLFGGITTIGLGLSALSDETGFVAENAGPVIIGGGLSAAVLGGWLLGSPSTRLEWVTVPKSELRAKE